jgi:hypothetical protein
MIARRRADLEGQTDPEHRLRADAIRRDADEDPAGDRAGAQNGQRQRCTLERDALVLHERHEVDRHHHLVEPEQHPRGDEKPKAAIRERLAQRRAGRAVRGIFLRSRIRVLGRKACEQAAGNGEDPDERAEDEIGRPPAESLDHEGREARARDEREVQPGQHDAQRQTTPLDKPPGHRRRRHQVHRRHRDAEQHAEDRIEVPQRIDP